jgi:hypothetical protein
LPTTLGAQRSGHWLPKVLYQHEIFCEGIHLSEQQRAARGETFQISYSPVRVDPK